MLLSLVTNDFAMPQAADDAGIDRIFVDLEQSRKSERQAGRSLFLSDHSTMEVRRIRNTVRRADVMVRLESPLICTAEQIDEVIDYGAAVVLLPYFHAVEEAAWFVDKVAGRAVVALLVETPEAVAVLPALCRLPGVGEIHVGLNDLTIGLGRRFLFDVVADGTIDRICELLRGCIFPFGFGGIARLSRTDLPVNPEWMLAEQVAQGATRGWLGRTFRDAPPPQVHEEVIRIRNAVEYWHAARAEDLAVLRACLRRQIVAESGKLARAGLV
jgi:hypothetical protein